MAIPSTSSIGERDITTTAHIDVEREHYRSSIAIKEDSSGGSLSVVFANGRPDQIRMAKIRKKTMHLSSGENF